MRFKEGDKVKVLNHPYGSCGQTGCQHFNREMTNLVGKNITIRFVSNGQFYRIDEDSGEYMWSECMFSKNKKQTKPKPIKFVVGWEEDVDPYKTFSDEKEMKKFLRELSKKRDLRENSVEVFEVKSHYKVRFSTFFRLTKMKKV